MGQKTSKGAVSITNANGRIRLRWRYQKSRYSLSLSHYSKAALLQAKKIALQIEQDILSEKFDGTLASYKPRSNQEPEIIIKKSLVEHFEFWVKQYRRRLIL